MGSKKHLPAVRREVPSGAAARTARIIKWATGVPIVIGWAFSARNQATVDFLAAATATWTFYVIWMAERVRRIKSAPVRAGIKAIAGLLLAVGAWVLARQILPVPPPARPWTPSEFAEAIVKKLPTIPAPTLRQETPAEIPRPAPIPTPAQRRAFASQPMQTLTPTSERQLQLVEEQNKIAKEQTKLLTAQLQPLFRFVPGRRAIGSETFDSLEIWNDGAPLRNYQIFQAGFIEVGRSIKDASGSPAWASRFIPAYYFIRRDYMGDARTGLLVILYAWRDPAFGGKGRNLTKEFERLSAEASRNYPPGDVTISKRVILNIEYTDRGGAGHEDLYEIYPPQPEIYRPPVPHIRAPLNQVAWQAVAFSWPVEGLTVRDLLEKWDRGEIKLDSIDEVRAAP